MKKCIFYRFSQTNSQSERKNENIKAWQIFLDI